MRAVYGRAFDGDAMESCLDDRVLLGMDGTADLMPLTRRDRHLIAQAAKFQAIRCARGSPIVSGSQNTLIPDYNRPHVMTSACGALSDKERQFHEILVPVRANDFLLYGCHGMI